jgi:hypothetical protein
MAAVNFGGSLGGFKERRKRILHQVVLRFGLWFRAEEAGVHHPAIDAAGNGEGSDGGCALKRDARAEGMFFVANNEALFRAGKAEGCTILERTP